jgi:muramoyltetrapeptide carboxypeptidase LdcA involved in peptidoglycan recycling
MITYPVLEEGATIGVTAPSSGINNELHDLLRLAGKRMEQMGFRLLYGETVWTQMKAKSAPAPKRAAEFNEWMQNDRIGLIFPPWGGELLVEILEHIDFVNLKTKWILGYSDISVLLLAVTLQTGMATAHGTNLIDLRGEQTDRTTAMWHRVLQTKTGESVTQHSSPNYQEEWDYANPSPCVFHLTEQTYWKVIGHTDVNMRGRLLGGCIDVIRHLIGTPYGSVPHFQAHCINNEPIVWYLENCELSATDLRRSLVQMKLAGWFDNCAGVMFGRSAVNRPIDGYTAEDVYDDLANELQVPVVYDIDCGHVPPQITFINGAYAEVEVTDGKGIVRQTFKP